jgi:hypothetical protein
MLSALDLDEVGFFIHVDKKVSIDAFREVIQSASLKAEVQFVKREDGQWGRLGIVKATLNALTAILAAGSYHRIVLLSGMDYLLASPYQIRTFFEQNQDKNYMTYFPIRESSNWWVRLSAYHFTLFGKYMSYPSTSRSWKRKLLDSVLCLKYPRTRQLPSDLTPYGGSQWWCITPELARYILNFLGDHPKYVTYHEDSLLPDEMFFQTIVLNAKDQQVLSSLVNDNLKFIDWSRPKPRPAVFTHQDFNLLCNSGKLFARKFDVNKDTRILDMLDERIKIENLQIK